MSRTRFITRTAVILALAIVFQNLRLVIGAWPQSTLIIGSLVNLTLIVATGAVGLVAGLVISFVTPIVAFAQGHLPHVWFMPVTMIGNAVLVLVYYLFKNSRFAEPFNAFLGIIIGALVKWAAMYWLGVVVVLGMFVPDLPQKKAAAIAAAFNFPQLITATVGGVLGILVIKALKRSNMVD